MAATKDEISRRIGRLASDAETELMDRVERLRTELGLTDAEMFGALVGWGIDMDSAWADYVSANEKDR